MRGKLRQLAACAVLAAALCGNTGAQQVAEADLSKVLENADRLLGEARAAYDEARAKSSLALFVEAGFKVEDARIKYLVLQEIGADDKKKVAAERLRQIVQLLKLINDGRVAVAPRPADAPAAEEPPKAPEPAPAPVVAEPKAPPVPGAPAAPEPQRRAAIPEPARLKEAEKTIKDLFKQEYAAKAPADRRALAKTLFEQGNRASDDVAARWVLYREAQELAAQSGDPRLAVSAVDAASTVFDVDRLALLSGVLATVAKAVKTPEDASAAAKLHLGMADDLVGVDEFEQAEKAAATALALAKRGNDPVVATRASIRAKEAADAKSKYQSMKKTLQTLARDSEDGGANLEMGQFLCFYKGSWDLGLRFLAKASDAGLRAVAEKELTYPNSTIEQIALADAWSALADKEKGAARKEKLLQRARVWYLTAQPAATGLLRVRIEKRLEATPMLPGEPINLFKLIDLKKDVINGSWSMQDGALTCKQVHCSRIQIPYLLPAEYDLAVTMERIADDFFHFGLVSEKHAFGAVLMGYGRAGFEMVDGLGVQNPMNPTGINGLNWPTGRSLVVKAAVRKTGVRIYIDGQLVFEYQGPLNRLTANRDWGNPDPRMPYLGSHLGGTLYTAVKLTPLGEPGKPLR
jgi:hypothetical protein